MRKTAIFVAMMASSIFALSQETTCIVLKDSEKEFRIVKDCQDPVKAFEDFLKRTGRTGREYRIIFEGDWYKLIFE